MSAALELNSFWISLKTACSAGAVTFVLGILAAWAVLRVRSSWLRFLLDTCFVLPMVLPPTVAGFMLLSIFGAQRPLGMMLENTFGWRIAFQWSATVLAAVVVSFPLMYRSARAGFEQLPKNLLDEGKMLGLDSLGLLRYIMIPCTLPSIATGVILSFMRGLGEYGATAMIAGNIAGKTRTLPLAIYAEVAAGHMERAWQYVWVMLVVAVLAVFGMNFLQEKSAQ